MGKVVEVLLLIVIGGAAIRVAYPLIMVVVMFIYEVVTGTWHETRDSRKK